MAIALGNLGNAYYSLGDYAKQRDILERALVIQERAYGRDHTAVATTLGGLGMAYGELGDAAKKREYVTRSVKIFEDAYGPDHPHTAYYRNVLDTL